MTDRKPGSQISSSKKLKSSPTANDDVDNSSTIAQQSSKKKNKTRNENEIVLLYPNSSCSPEESVFSIDHILESIFGKLDRPTLLNCRLVSRRWAHFSSTFLQKINTFKIALNISNDLLICNGFQNRTIKDLITLMNNSINFPFPCTSFVLENYRSCKIIPLAQRFLSAHGPTIKKLKFDGYLDLSDLKRLLLTQAPNLEQLLLDGVRFARTASESRFSKSSINHVLFSKNSTSGPSNKPSFKNLKVFKCNSNIPDIFLQQLLECSPNLIEVFLKLDSLHCLVQPVNRLHLLKKLVIVIREANIESLKAIANNPSNNWAVQEIQCCDDNVDSVGTGNLGSLATEALSKILNGCSATCRTLSWKTVFEGFRIPRMIGVRHFSYEESILPDYIFPEGVSLGDTFPNLRSLEISCDDYYTEPLSIEKILDLDDSNPIPLPNVRKVSFNSFPGPELDTFLREMFPNAVIETPAVKSDEWDAESDDEDVESDNEDVESDNEDVESDDGKAESDDEDVESADEKAESDDEDVESDDGKAESDDEDEDVESDDGKAESDDEDVESDDEKAESDDEKIDVDVESDDEEL